MRRSFIHRPLFRLISPLFSGAIAYLLILLINNNVGALEELFLGQELYFCIGLSYLTHESSRLIILLFSRKGILQHALTGIAITVLACSVFVVLALTISIYIYFEQVLGYTPILSELIIFNSIFIIISWIHISLFIAHDVLNRSHKLKIDQEVELKQQLEEAFQQYKEGINPDLLFESLENLVVLSRVDVSQAEDYVDHLANVYRYVLSQHNELVSIQSEIEPLDHLVALFKNLPNREITFKADIADNYLLVPGTLLKIVETLVRMAIANPRYPLRVKLNDRGNYLEVSGEFLHRIHMLKNADILLRQLNTSYNLYSDTAITYSKRGNKHYFTIPKLMLSDESTYH